MQQAMDAGIVQNGLFGFQDGYFQSNTLEPFQGYFMRAFRDCTLVIPVNNSAALPAGTHRRIARHSVPSTARVAAGLRAAGLAPRETGEPGAAWLRRFFYRPSGPLDLFSGRMSSAVARPWLPFG